MEVLGLNKGKALQKLAETPGRHSRISTPFQEPGPPGGLASLHAPVFLSPRIIEGRRRLVSSAEGPPMSSRRRGAF